MYVCWKRIVCTCPLLNIIVDCQIYAGWSNILYLARKYDNLQQKNFS